MFDPTSLLITLPTSHVLEILTDHPTTVKFLRGMNVPSIIIHDLHALSIPQSKMRLYEHHYNFIQEQHPYRMLPFALDDWILAYLAAENQWGVVSMDHHLLTNLREFLDYDAYWPEDVHSLPADAMVLLDSNILLHFCDQNRAMRHRIRGMFLDNPSVTFVISANILEEMGRVYHRKFERSPIQAAKVISHSEIAECDVTRFVDDFGRFESGKDRRKRKQKQGCRISSVLPRKNKWERLLEN